MLPEELGNDAVGPFTEVGWGGAADHGPPVEEAIRRARCRDW